jgi:hypothetical protein
VELEDFKLSGKVQLRHLQSLVEQFTHFRAQAVLHFEQLNVNQGD